MYAAIISPFIHCEAQTTFGFVIALTLLIAMLPASTSSTSDISLNMYTANGDLAQIKFASRSVERSNPSFAFVAPYRNVDDELTHSCCIMIAVHPSGSPLSDESIRFSKSIEVYDESTAALFGGYAPDIEYARSHLNHATQSHRFTFGETPSLHNYATDLAEWITQGLYVSDEDEDNDDHDEAFLARPLAISVLLGAIDPRLKRPRLLRVDNSGATAECTFTVLGGLSQQSASAIKQIVMGDPGMDVGEKVKRVLEFIQEKVDYQVGAMETNEALQYDCVVITSEGVHRPAGPQALRSRDQVVGFIHSAIKKSR